MYELREVETQYVRRVLSQTLAAPENLALAGPEKLGEWEICCFCFKQHKSGIHVRKDPRSRELMCGVQAEKTKQGRL